MTPEQRLSAINSILATGVMRLIMSRKQADNEAKNSQVTDKENATPVAELKKNRKKENR